MANSISEVKENEILNKSIIRDWKNGIQHNIPVQATFSLFNYINITPYLNYTERWYSSSLKTRYNEDTKSAETDTIYGFNRVWDYSTSISASTKLYGNYQPIQSIFGDKVNMIRHVITPSVSLSYRPDFGAAKYGYYDDYSYADAKGEIQTVSYSRYSNSLYGTPGTGKSGNVSFSVSNNLEMKLKEVNDTATIYKKVSLIDDLSFGTSYNMSADSMKWSDISASIRIKFGPKYTLNLSSTIDPYEYEVNSNGAAYKVDRLLFKSKGIPGRFTGTGTSFSYTLNNETFKKKDKKSKKTGMENSSADGQMADGAQTEAGVDEAGTTGSVDAESALYQPLKMPWSINLNYSLRYERDLSSFNTDKMYYDFKFTQNLSLSGNFALTDKWKFSASTNYNFEEKEFSTMNCTVSRDLHCWEMSAQFIPVGRYKSYNFSIRVKSSMLQDLKYEQHQNPNDNIIWKGY
jgi:hypothetical protein